MFFEKLLHNTQETSVISGQLDIIRKAQSMDNLDVDTAEEPLVDDRPRSASPNLTSRIQDGGQEIPDDHEAETEDSVEKSTENTDSVATEEVRSEPDSIDTPMKLPLSKKISSDSKVTNYAKDNLNISLPPTDGNSSTPAATNGSSVPESPASSEKSKCRPFLDIPEFNWSPAHQKLLTELLFSIEKDIQVWKT